MRMLYALCYKALVEALELCKMTRFKWGPQDDVIHKAYRTR